MDAIVEGSMMAEVQGFARGWLREEIAAARKEISPWKRSLSAEDHSANREVKRAASSPDRASLSRSEKKQNHK